MLTRRDAWAGHYHGDDTEVRLDLRYSYSDRIRYYWGLPEAVEAVRELENALRGREIPATLASQFFGRIAERVHPTDDVRTIVKSYVSDVLETYSRACRPERSVG